MKNKIKLILTTLSAFAMVFSFALAQNSSTTKAVSKETAVATVNIYNATNKEIGSNKYSVSFEIFNRVGIQSNIRYGLQLVSAKEYSVADTLLANESLTLGERQTKKITMEYEIPGFVADGEYKLLIVAKNQNGLPLAVMPAGFPEKIITVSNKTSAPDLSSCYLTIIGDASSTARYTLANLATIKSGETIEGHCVLKNGNIDLNNLKITLVTHKRDQFGDILKEEALPTLISIKKNEVKNISFTIPTLTIAGLYDLDTFLTNSREEKISESERMRYLVVGAYATIQNTILDKTSYKKGDMADLNVFWTSQVGAVKTLTLNVAINDVNSAACGSATKSLSLGKYAVGTESVKVKIDKDCPGAVALVSITDENGNTLDTTTINPNKPTSAVNLNSTARNASILSLGAMRNYVIVFVIVLVLIGYGILVLRKDKENNNLKK